MPASPGAGGDVGRWLALLRDGSEEEQQLARTELGLILEARGLLDEAAEAYERNVADGVSDRRPYERLSALAQARGDAATEARVLRALADLLVPPSPPPPAAPDVADVAKAEAPAEAPADSPDPVATAGEPTRGATTPDAAPATMAPVLGPDGEQPRPDAEQAAEEASEEPPTTRLVVPSIAPHATSAQAPSVRAPDASTAAAPSDAADLTEPPPGPASGDVEPSPDPPAPPVSARSARRRGRTREEDEDPGVALHHVLELHPEETRHPAAHHATPRSTSPVVAGMSRTLITLALLVPVLVVIVGAALSWQGTPGAGTAVPPTAVLTATASLSPLATVEMRLIAGTPSPLPSPAIAQTQPPTPTPTPVATPLAARCADAGLRFPETRAPEEAVRAAYREYLTRQGVIDATSVEVSRLGEAYAARHEEVVAGWMAVTLQREQRGLTSFPLADYVASDVVVTTGPGEYQLRATISPQGWTEIRAWPAETCEGAFMRSPANARWVDLMQASVGDITWALPTRQPAR